MTALQGATFPTTSVHHPASNLSAPAVTTYYPLADGAGGTLQTLSLMRECVIGQAPPDYSGYTDPHNLSAATQICAMSGNADATQQAQIAALFAFCRDQISYIEHPFNMQVVQDCKRTLESRQGDCVSKSVCLATLLACMGITSRFVAQAPDDDGFTHVYVEAWGDNDWLALDPIADGQQGRPLGDVGWRQQLPDGGFETPYEI